MKLPHRRQFLHVAAGAIALPAVSRIARAQAYPTRPVRIVVAFAPGGPQDILARLMGQWLSERLGKEFEIENRPGSAGNIGTEAVVNAPADGYTLLMVGPPNAINAALFPNLTFDFIRDIAPIAAIVRVPHVMLINPSLPVTTVPEFIEFAKGNAGNVKFSSAGVGSGVHLAGELFKILTGVKMVHVPYRSAPLAIGDLVGGQVQVMFDTTPASVGYIKSGKLRALAITTTTRSEVLSNLPTVGEFVAGFEASSVFGLGLPKNCPVEVVEQLNKQINAALGEPSMKSRLAELGGTVLPGSPADFGKLIAEETEKWGKVIRAANIKAE